MSANPNPAQPIPRYRWRICALLFVATTINYMDRSILGVLAPTLQYKVFAWTDQDYANINAAFKAAYAIGMLTMGAVVDHFGTKIGYTLSIALWTFFGILHAAVRPAFSVIGFAAARFGLGFGEAGNYPAAVKTVAEWFPRQERALVSGIFNAGSNIGAILAPLAIPLVVGTDGSNWQFAFLITGTFSALWIVAWWRTYAPPASHPRLSPVELAFIQGDQTEPPAEEKIRWHRLLPLPETWAFALAKITDAAWWFYLFWGGKYLYDRFGLDIKSLALPLIIIYLVADVGSIAGGWLSSHFIKRGWTTNRARKTTLLLCALCILPVTLVTQIDTRFEVNAALFSRLERDHAGVLPAGDRAALQTLAGRSFTSAKDFIAAARVARSTPAIGTSGGIFSAAQESALLASARSDNLYWVAVALIALASVGHQAWSANLFAVVMDVFPKKATASVTGIGGMIGATASLLCDLSLGRVLTTSGPAGYFFAFLLAGLVYIVVLGIMQVLMPRMTPLGSDLRRIA